MNAPVRRRALGGDVLFRNCCSTVPGWFRRDVAGGADRVASGGSTAAGAGTTVPREWGPGARPEGSHQGAWGRPFHRESAAPGVVSAVKTRMGKRQLNDRTAGEPLCEIRIELPEIPKSVAIC
jgi:hypothetical protein